MVRSTRLGDEMSKLIRHSYIHGLMAGEALDADPEEKLMTAEALIADRKVKTFNLV